MNFQVLRLQSLYGDTVQMQSTLDAVLNRAVDLDPQTTVEITDDERKFLLKLATLFVRKLLLDIACYPLTDSAVIYFDEFGNPL